ncbi:MAG: hypothetical protein O3A81_03985 [bacterium]|nr:hypothetical protein [bacterium]
MNTTTPEDQPFLSPDEYVRRMQESSEPSRDQEAADSFFGSPDAMRYLFSTKPAKATSPLDPQTRNEIELASQIESIQADFYTFEAKMLSRLSSNDERYNSLKEPFDIMRNNENNPLKNSAVVERLAAQKNISVPEMALGSLKDPRHFSYGPMPENAAQGHMLYAGFAPTHQMIAFRSDAQFNDFDNLILHHELRHVGHYGNRRKEMGDAQYFQLIFAQHQKPYSFLEDELDAYGGELDALDLLLDGKLKERGSNGMDEITSTLQLRKDQQLTAFFLAKMSEAYYEPKAEGEQYSKAFTNFIIQTQLHDGYKIYSMREGRVCELQQ